MCGITGLLDRRSRLADEPLVAAVRLMNDVLAHRGPDGDGIWTDAAAGIALAHRRLAIVDLSPTGVQPMHSSDGRWVVTYNGEIFNFSDLRAELVRVGVQFRGTSDTEVMIEGIARWGVRETLARLVGMFAIALWDRKERSLWLVRDRLGVKPLYYACDGTRLVFGSELKALRAAPGFAPSIDRDALVSYFRHANVPGAATIYKESRKLLPGTLLVWREGSEPSTETYWSARAVAERGRASWNAPADPGSTVETLDKLLLDAVARRMVADVPLGAFLSGGIDSSTVVALMQAQSSRPVRTFTIGYDRTDYDEARHAAAVAAHLGTDHTELHVDPSHARDVIQNLPEIYDEPFADASQIPTYLVARMTRAHVKVALSGDGGDEVFAGYNRHVWASRLERLVRLPHGLRRVAACALRAAPAGILEALLRPLPAARRPVRPAEKAAKLAALLEADDAHALYRELVSQWPDPAMLVPGAREAPGPADDPGIAGAIPEFGPRMQLLDTLGYLPDDVLTKVDRATMAVALEARNPFLDHRVVEHAWTLPPELKVDGGKGKRILREVLSRYVPRDLFERPKMGFAVPVGEWLRGPLREWAEDLLAPAAIVADGILDPAPVAHAWRAHLGGADRTYRLWTVLMFQAWRKRWA
ncbi:MAG: asparagine synthase (glutamine-hydrolyzing) [Rhodospirillales bacterium]|nr:asparagine synthase (glutamine-hydrolyzing) [Rhodospirillales bacterium]